VQIFANIGEVLRASKEHAIRCVCRVVISLALDPVPQASFVCCSCCHDSKLAEMYSKYSQVVLGGFSLVSHVLHSTAATAAGADSVAAGALAHVARAVANRVADVRPKVQAQVQPSSTQNYALILAGTALPASKTT
jgi:hypothetical protein